MNIPQDNLYKTLIQTSIDLNLPVKYDLLFGNESSGNHALSMKGIYHPVCIKEKEWYFIYNFVKEHNLIHGYELATGVGISCLAPGLAMKNNGKVVTMDAYIEENSAHANAYRDSDKTVYDEATGLSSAKQFIDYFGLKSTVFPKTGWSPDDVEAKLSEVFDLSVDSLDYVFIDGEHTGSSVLRDLKSVEPFVNKNRYVIFLHDTHVLDRIDDISNYLLETYGQSWQVCPGCSHLEGGFNLSYLFNFQISEHTPS